ncbi:SphA family protein [Paraburkholderia caledonica]
MSIKFKNNWFRFIILVLAINIACAAKATENGLTNYPIGVNGTLDGLYPLPGGNALLIYNLYSRSTSFKNHQGSEEIPGFGNTTYVSSYRFLHTWDYAVGPYTFSSGFNIPFISTKTSIMGISNTKSGVGSFDIEPLHLNYTNPSKTFFSSLYVDVFIQSGGYNSSRLANTHQNYDSIDPLYSYTWFIDQNWSTSNTLGFEIPLGSDGQTHYKSGSVFFANPSVEYTPSGNQKVHFALAGYYIQQLNSDELAGSTIQEGGGKIRALGIGPEIRYDFTKTTSAIIKYYNEFAVRNRAASNLLWFQIGFLF